MKLINSFGANHQHMVMWYLHVEHNFMFCSEKMLNYWTDEAKEEQEQTIALNKSMLYLSKKKLFCLWTFLASFFTVVTPFIIKIDSMKKKFQIPPPSGFSGTPGKPIKLPSPLIGILSEFSSSWKVPNVGSRLWLLQGHNLSTIVNYTMKSAKLSNAIRLHKCFIQCTV